MSDINALRDFLLKLSEELVNKGAIFADFRLESYLISSFSIIDGSVKDVTYGIDSGLAVRVLYKGFWGFSATSKLDNKDSIRGAVNEAFNAAKALSMKGEGKSNVYILEALRDDVKASVKVDPRNVGFDVKVKDSLKLNDLLYKESSVKSVTIKYADIIGDTVYVSSEGRDIRQELCYTWVYVWVTGRENTITASVRDELGSIDGYTVWSKNPQESVAEKLIKKLKMQLRAKTPRGGNYPAVLAPEVVGVFAHEAFGHLSEADLTMSGSAVMDKLGKKIASEEVTIVDDPTIPGGFGTFRYDDEGVETRPVYLIRKGVIEELMVNREYAKLLNIEPTGNARAESYKVPPLIRMRNTVILPGDYSVDELFEDIKFGYYLVSFRGGQANLDGTFQVGIQEAYEVMNGEIGEPVRNMSISGNTLETLSLIDAVAKDFKIGYGRCGKGQMVFVSDGGPHIRVKKITVGGWE